ncbi:MAG: metalloregulator ArsR/SmtB family transcription factor [Thermoplasmata archaeon]|nr:metalloregulator ArsR/SmtB family transcription factor [Thermoplasmata archaeon]
MQESETLSTEARPPTLTAQIQDYWDQRAQGYTLATRISYVDDGYTMKAIGHFINLNRHMRVADMGTGCGLMAMWMASLGHDVTAVDNSSAMLAEARKNARDAGLEIDFVAGDMENPGLEPGSFDLVVAKSSVWCLQHPAIAYANWVDLLKPGGHLIVVDGNYYLDLYDEDYRKRKEYFDMKDGRETGLHYRTNVNHVDTNIIRELSKQLPLTRERRPTWDVEALLGLGMTDIHVKSLDKVHYSTLTESGLVKIPVTFIVVAQKPYSDMTPHDAAVFEPPIDDDLIPGVTERIRNSGDMELGILKALADQKRMDILRALESGRMSTTQLSKAVSASPSLVSHNLSILREQGIVVSERDGKEVIHRIGNPYALETLMEICGVIVCGKPGTDERRLEPKYC